MTKTYLALLSAILTELQLIRSVLINTELKIELENEQDQYRPDNGNRLKPGWSEADE